MSAADDLRVLLRRLHAELQQATALDDESRSLLRVLAQDIEQFRAHGPASRELAARFEAEHPTLAATLRQIADTLGKAGI
jgi:hypothetical protein